MYKVAFYKMLQWAGAITAIGAFTYMGFEALESDWQVPRETRTPSIQVYVPDLRPDSTVYSYMQEGTCLIYIKIYGTNEVVQLSSDDCMAAIGAATHHMDKKIQAAKELAGGEKL